MFHIKSDQDYIYHQNELVTVRDVIGERRKVDPDCKLTYHNFADKTEGETGEVEITLKHKVYFMTKKDASESEKKKSQVNLAAFLPLDIWASESCKVAKIMWATKWATQGLAPVRPLVILTEDVVLGPGRAAWIVGSEA